MLQLLAHLFGDYILQSDWMAQNKTKNSDAAIVHALIYSLCFVPLLLFGARHSWIPQIVDYPVNVAAWLVIFSTHFLIDRFRLARYVVWAKNWLGAPLLPVTDFKNGGVRFYSESDGSGGIESKAINYPISICPTGYPPATPIWLSTWLLIIADNTLHLAINYAALRWL